MSQAVFDYATLESPSLLHPVGRPVTPAVRDHLLWAILSTVLCFTPTGVVAVVHAARVKPLLAAGQVGAARRASTLAARFCWVSLGVTVCFVLVIYLGAGG